jgi:hypothetical protein
MLARLSAARFRVWSANFEIRNTGCPSGLVATVISEA